MAFTLSFGAMAAERHGMGFVPEDPVKYAATPEITRYRAYFPAETDLSAFFPKPGNQGKQGSCAAWATGYAVRSYLEARRQGSHPTKPDYIFSPAFIFNQINGGNCDDGGSLSEAMNLLQNHGAASLAEFPYEEGNCSRLPDAQVMSDAARFRIGGWKRVDTERLDDIKGQIYMGNPVVFGMFVSDEFEKLKKNQLYDDISSPRSGGHAMVLVGYSEPKKAFKVINSWGEYWGDDGFGWISYRAFRKWTQNAFVMQLASAAPGPLPQAAKEPEIAPAVLPEPEPLPRPDPGPGPAVITPPQPAPHPAVLPRPKPEPEPDIHADLKRKLAGLIQQAKCADLHGVVSGGGRVNLTGFAGQQQDLAHIETELKKSGASVSVDAVLRPWPQCEALLTFRDILAKPSGLKLSVSGRNSGVLNEGDRLSIEVTTPAYPSYLYLTYIQANGDAVHLVRPLGRLPKPLPPDTRLQFGGGEGGGRTFTISPPFGDEMLIAVAAASPLLDDDSPKTQTEREYLTGFRQAFLAAPSAGGPARVISAAVTMLVTHPKH